MLSFFIIFVFLNNCSTWVDNSFTVIIITLKINKLKKLNCIINIKKYNDKDSKMVSNKRSIET
jgi:hypothetical protein